MLRLRPPAAYGFLACHTQYVIRDYGKLQYQPVGVKLPDGGRSRSTAGKDPHAANGLS